MSKQKSAANVGCCVWKWQVSTLCECGENLFYSAIKMSYQFSIFCVFFVYFADFFIILVVKAME